VEGYYTLGITYWQNGDLPATIEAIRSAIRLRPEYAEAHYMLGTALKQKGELAEAAAALEEAIRLNPNTPGPFNTLAQIRQAQGDQAGAKALFTKAAEVKRKLEAGQERKLGTMGHATMDVPQGKPAH
jgi:Flp pilus assembly protein TadD